MTYRILFDKEFVREYRKLDNSLQIEGDKKLYRLKENPFLGKPLKFFPNLFELYLGSYRIYYVVDKAENKVLVLAIEHKDEQQRFLRNLSREKIKKILDENP